VDPWFIVDKTPEEARIIRVAREVNDHKPEWVLEKLKAAIMDVLAGGAGNTMGDVKVACLGLAFKPDIDDLRESPAVEIVKNLAKLGCQVFAVEPNIEALPAGLCLENLVLSPLDEALATADVVCVLVKHASFVEQLELIAGQEKLIDAVGLVR
jgi:UDP-N-acetyl-D-mannosaminuronic acid dehydrogenase